MTVLLDYIDLLSVFQLYPDLIYIEMWLRFTTVCTFQLSPYLPSMPLYSIACLKIFLKEMIIQTGFVWTPWTSPWLKACTAHTAVWLGLRKPVLSPMSADSIFIMNRITRIHTQYCTWHKETIHNNCIILLCLLAIVFSPQSIYWGEICSVRNGPLQSCHCRAVSGISLQILLVFHSTACCQCYL